MLTEHTHGDFLKNVERSHDAVLAVAAWLCRRGNKVILNSLKTVHSPTHSEWKDHADTGDLYLLQRIEVKRINQAFTCREDWPFRNKFIVCAQHAWDRSSPKPKFIIYLNRDSTHCGILDCSTRPLWYLEEKSDRRYPGYKQWNYMCETRLVSFMEFKK